MTVNYQEIIGSIVQVLIIAAVPIILEIITGLGQILVTWLKSKTQNVIITRFISDIEAIATALKQTTADELKKAMADGKVTEDEKKQAVMALKAKAQDEISKLLKHYPLELTSYLHNMATNWLEAKVFDLKWFDAKMPRNPIATQAPTSQPGNDDLSDLSPEDRELALSMAIQSK